MTDLAPVITVSPEWLNSDVVQSIFDIFERNGETIYVVGGPVRDAIMNRPVSDIDFSTSAHPAHVDEIIRAAGYRTEPTGIDHGTISAIIDSIPYEITTFRKDVATDGRRAVVEFATDWTDDAERRDFTFNALYMDRRGNVFDPWGHKTGVSGVEDAKNRYIRFVGDAEKRITEDYLRILRLFRFMSVLGVKAERSAILAAHYHRRGLATISGERISQETMKMLKGDNVVNAIYEMTQVEIWPFDTITENGINFGYSIQHKVDHSFFDRFSKLVATVDDPIVRLAFIIGAVHNSQTAAKVLKFWKPANDLVNRVDSINAMVNSLWKLRMEISIEPDKRSKFINQFRSWAKDDVISDAFSIYVFHDAASIDFTLDDLLNVPMPVFPISGKDILAFGVKPGVIVGKMLKVVEEMWRHDGCTYTKDEALYYAKLVVDSPDAYLTE